jgi:hypothetical protein
MEKLIFKYRVTDGYTYAVDTYIPFEYVTKSAAKWDIMATAFQTFLNDNLDGWKDENNMPDLSILGVHFSYDDFFESEPIPNSKKLKIEYRPQFEILTIDEFFEGKEELFS